MAKALADLKVLDLTQWEAGPQSTLMMAFLGADVVKVEPPGTGDPARHFSTVPLKPGTDSFYFIFYNLNKKSVTLDLEKAKGREILKDMVKWADVLVENFEPGTMERWGLDYCALSEVNPGLIYGRVTGYGSYGPYANYPCVDATAQAMAGMMSWTGWPDKPPVKPAPSIGETGAGVNMFSAIMMALHQKMRTGKGQYVEVAMTDTCVNLCRVALTGRQAEMDPLFKGEPAKRAGLTARGSSPAGLYPTKDEGVFLNFMFGRAQDQFDMLITTLGHPEVVGNPQYASPEKRYEIVETVDKMISDWTSQRSGYEAFTTLAGKGISTGITYTTTQAMNDPHILYRKKVVELTHPVRGKYKTLGYPANLEKSPVDVANAPLLGQDNEGAYARILGYTKDDLKKLKEVGVI